MLVLCLPVGIIFEEPKTETRKEFVYDPLDALVGGGGEGATSKAIDI